MPIRLGWASLKLSPIWRVTDHSKGEKGIWCSKVVIQTYLSLLPTTC